MYLLWCMGLTSRYGILYVRLFPPILLLILTRSSTAQEGLKSMTRNHIHCAVGLAGDSGVISGAYPIFPLLNID